MKELDSEGLQAIRDADAAMGPDEELQFYPPVSTHRRQLLKRLDAAEEVLADQRRLARELDVLINGEDGAASQPSLCDIVAQLRNMRDTQVTTATGEHLDKLMAIPPVSDTIELFCPDCDGKGCFTCLGYGP